jgi:hypothetical protein
MKGFITWLLRKFWFPILLLILAALAKKYPWAKEAHAKLKKLR